MNRSPIPTLSRSAVRRLSLAIAGATLALVPLVGGGTLNAGAAGTINPPKVNPSLGSTPGPSVTLGGSVGEFARNLYREIGVNSPTLNSLGATVSTDAPYSDEDNTRHPQATNSIWTCPSGGSCDNTYAYIYNSNEYDGCGFWQCDLNYEGNFAGYWAGCCPYNASSMSLSSNWHVDGCAVNFTVDAGGPGAGISGSGSDGYWNGSVSNNYKITDTYNGVHFYTYCGWWATHQSVTTNAAFSGGAENFTTTAEWSSGL